MPRPHPRFDRADVPNTERRLDPYIEAYVPHGARVMDLGCGRGELLERLITSRGIQARGVEIHADAIKTCIEKGLSVYQGDIDDGFEDFDDGVFDIVILNLTVAMLHTPHTVLREVVRIGKKAIVSFYNLGYLPHRQKFAASGCVSELHPDGERWYESLQIHPFSILDFERLCARLDISCEHATWLDDQYRSFVADTSQAQDRASTAVYLLRRAG